MLHSTINLFTDVFNTITVTPVQSNTIPCNRPTIKTAFYEAFNVSETVVQPYFIVLCISLSGGSAFLCFCVLFAHKGCDLFLLQLVFAEL